MSVTQTSPMPSSILEKQSVSGDETLACRIQNQTLGSQELRTAVIGLLTPHLKTSPFQPDGVRLTTDLLVSSLLMKQPVC